ncbi:MAG: hypothetical protein WAL83_02040 [Arenicellales bacterium]
MEPSMWMQTVAAWIVPVKSDLVMAGGVLSAITAVFHLTFWRRFNWRQDLRSLTFVNRGMVQILNLSVAFVLAIFAYLSLALADDLTSSQLGSRLLAVITLFWLARAVEQVVFFRLRRRSSRVSFVIFLLGGSLYGAPALVALWRELAST